MGKNPRAVLTSSPVASEAPTQNKSSCCGAGGDPRLRGSGFSALPLRKLLSSPRSTSRVLETNSSKYFPYSFERIFEGEKKKRKKKKRQKKPQTPYFL